MKKVKKKAGRPARVGPPPYCLHKSSGHAYVTLDGVPQYLGKHNSPASLKKYSQLIAQHAAGAIIEKAKPLTIGSNLTVAEVALKYIDYAKGYYKKNGRQTDEVQCIKSALRPLADLFPDVIANEFGPLMLKAVREAMIPERDKKVGRGKKTVKVRWTRRYINMSVNRIRRMFKWAVSNELVVPTVLTALQAVEPLMEGRTTAREHMPRHAVPIDAIQQIKKNVPKRTRDMIDVWLLTGARPGELVTLTGEMIDKKKYRSKGVWIAELKDHKMAHKGKQRFLVFGPKAQAILKRYEVADPTKRLFPINRATASDAMKKACRELNIPVYTAHWLRHTKGTEVRDTFGLDHTQATLGHAHASISELYANVDLEKAIEVASKVG